VDREDNVVLVAYDSSAESRAAVVAAVGLFPRRRLIVVTVSEPGLAAAMASASSISGRTPSTTITAEVTRLARDHAAEAAREGAELARGLGATAKPISIIDEANVAVAIAAQADREDVPVIVVGSRGLGRVKAPLLGSTSQGLLRRTERPVLVVRAQQ
jgi:nucleotide-binding universal stress UspA family protein